MFNSLIRSFIFKCFDSRIICTLKKMDLKYVHDNNSRKSEFFIQNSKFALIIQYHKNIKGFYPELNVIFRSAKVLKNEFISLEDLEEFVEENM